MGARHGLSHPRACGGGVSYGPKDPVGDLRQLVFAHPQHSFYAWWKPPKLRAPTLTPVRAQICLVLSRVEARALNKPEFCLVLTTQLWINASLSGPQFPGLPNAGAV